MTPLLAAFAAVLTFLEGAAPEIRERCSDTTYQKHQALIIQVTQARDFAETFDPAAVPSGPSMEDLVNRFLVMIDTSEAQAAERVLVQAGMVKTLAGLMAVLGLTEPEAPASV